MSDIEEYGFLVALKMDVEYINGTVIPAFGAMETQRMQKIRKFSPCRLVDGKLQEFHTMIPEGSSPRLKV